MKGLEISKAYYLEYGKKMLDEKFSDVIDRIAVGLVGEGSECLGYDDCLSQDHDFEPGFCLFITKEDYENFGFRLERAYAKLPNEFMGLKRNIISPVGGIRHGVIVIDEFYKKYLGKYALLDTYDYLNIPSFYLLNASNGEMFKDNLQEFSKIRNQLIKGYPLDIRKKKLAAHVVLMAQSGQYNYPRCVNRGEYGAAQLAIFEFIKNTISVIYLLNNVYEPFYKWVYRGMNDLKILNNLSEILQCLTEMDNLNENFDIKNKMIDEIVLLVVEELNKQGLSDLCCNDLEKHANAINDKIKDEYLRNLHIMAGSI